MPCRNHPQIESGLDHCHRCGFSFCDDCRVEFQGRTHCAGCKAEAVGLLESGGTTASSGDLELPAWERRAELGMASAFWQTIKAVMTDPARFFRRMDTSVTTWDCLAVPCVLAVLGAIVSGILQLTIMGGMMAFLSQMGGGMGDDASQMVLPQMFSGTFGACIGVFLSPVAAILGAFMVAGLMHLFLMMTGKVGAPYHQTLRGYCYAQAPNILAVIPFLGSVVAFFWTIWTSVVMVKEVHKSTWGMAWMSVLSWMVLCCVLSVGAYAVVVALVVAVASQN